MFYLGVKKSKDLYLLQEFIAVRGLDVKVYDSQEQLSLEVMVNGVLDSHVNGMEGVFSSEDLKRDREVLFSKIMDELSGYAFLFSDVKDDTKLFVNGCLKRYYGVESDEEE